MSSQHSSSSLVEATATSTAFRLPICDPRRPLLVQAMLEGDVMVPFIPSEPGRPFIFRANASVVGASYEFQLIYVAASIDWNQYTLLMNVTWPNPSAEFSNYYHKTSGSWFDLWTQSLATGTLPPGEASDVREYQLRCEEVQQHEQQLSSVQNIQALIIQAVQRGARFRTSHKEGGTDIFWRGGHYVRSDFGENPSDQRYRHESKFLAMLFQFFQGEVIRNAPHGSLSELDAWRLILRQLKTNSD